MKLTRNYLVALGAVLLLGAAVVFFSVFYPAVGSASSLTVSFGTEAFVRSASSETAERFYKVWLRSEKASLPEVHPEPVSVTAFAKNGRVLGEYSLYVCSMMDRTAYLVQNESGRCRRLSCSDFSLLLSESAFLLPDTYGLPDYELRVSLSGGRSWTEPTVKEHFFCLQADGSFRETDVQTDRMGEIPEFSVAELSAWSLNPTVSPDSYSLTVYRNDTPIVTQSKVSAEELYCPTLEGDYNCLLTAVWELSVERDWYGESTYEIRFQVRSDPS